MDRRQVIDDDLSVNDPVVCALIAYTFVQEVAACSSGAANVPRITIGGIECTCINIIIKEDTDSSGSVTLGRQYTSSNSDHHWYPYSLIISIRTIIVIIVVNIGSLDILQLGTTHRKTID